MNGQAWSGRWSCIRGEFRKTRRGVGGVGGVGDMGGLLMT